MSAEIHRPKTVNPNISRNGFAASAVPVASAKPKTTQSGKCFRNVPHHRKSMSSSGNVNQNACSSKQLCNIPPDIQQKLAYAESKATKSGEHLGSFSPGRRGPTKARLLQNDFKARRNSKPEALGRARTDIQINRNSNYNNYYQQLADDYSQKKTPLSTRLYQEYGPPVIRSGRAGAPWRHVRQCVANSGNHLCFIDAPPYQKVISLGVTLPPRKMGRYGPKEHVVEVTSYKGTNQAFIKSEPNLVKVPGERPLVASMRHKYGPYRNITELTNSRGSFKPFISDAKTVSEEKKKMRSKSKLLESRDGKNLRSQSTLTGRRDKKKASSQSMSIQGSFVSSDSRTQVVSREGSNQTFAIDAEEVEAAPESLEELRRTSFSGRRKSGPRQNMTDYITSTGTFKPLISDPKIEPLLPKLEHFGSFCSHGGKGPLTPNFVHTIGPRGENTNFINDGPIIPASAIKHADMKKFPPFGTIDPQIEAILDQMCPRSAKNYNMNSNNCSKAGYERIAQPMSRSVFESSYKPKVSDKNKYKTKYNDKAKQNFQYWHQEVPYQGLPAKQTISGALMAKGFGC